MGDKKYLPKYAPVKHIVIKTAGKDKRVLARIITSLSRGDFETSLKKVENLPQTITVRTDSSFLYDTCIDDLKQFEVEYKCLN